MFRHKQKSDDGDGEKPIEKPLSSFAPIAAFFGSFMNLNFLLAGTVSVNPTMLVLGILVVFAWRVAGYWGLDRFVLPFISRRENSQNLRN